MANWEMRLNCSKAGMTIGVMMFTANIGDSVSECKRLVAQGAVRVNGQPVRSAMEVYKPGFEGTIRVGKKQTVRVRIAEREDKKVQDSAQSQEHQG